MNKNAFPFFVGLQRSKDVLFLLILLGSFVSCYFGTFLWLNVKYQGNESYYSHGYLVPFVSAYLIYHLRDRLRATRLSSSPAGLLIVVLSLAVHVFGALGDINFVSTFSLVTYLIGCSLIFLGKDMTRVIAFPLLFLFFMCPLPDIYLDAAALPLKSMATTLSHSLIDLAGIPCVREGFRLHLPESVFVVGTPCNGLRSLISLSAIGLLFTYSIRSPRRKKLVFLSLILPVSVALNGLRIAVLLLISHLFGQEAASPESYLHDGSGLVVFLLGLVILLLAGKRINGEEKAA